MKKLYLYKLVSAKEVFVLPAEDREDAIINFSLNRKKYYPFVTFNEIRAKVSRVTQREMGLDDSRKKNRREPWMKKICT